MKSSIKIACVAACLTAASAASWAIDGPGLKVTLEVAGFPQPSQGQASITFAPWLGDSGLPGRFEFDAWYLADRWYLVPDGFAEGGLVVRAIALDARRFSLGVGIGAAASWNEGAWAIPAAVDLGFSWRPWRWLGAEVRGLGLLYGDGFIVVPAAALVVATPIPWLKLRGGLRASFARSYDGYREAFSYLLGYGLSIEASR